MQGFCLFANFRDDFLNQWCDKKRNRKRRAKADGKRSHPNEQKIRDNTNVDNKHYERHKKCHE